MVQVLCGLPTGQRNDLLSDCQPLVYRPVFRLLEQMIELLPANQKNIEQFPLFIADIDQQAKIFKEFLTQFVAVIDQQQHPLAGSTGLLEKLADLQEKLDF